MVKVRPTFHAVIANIFWARGSFVISHPVHLCNCEISTLNNYTHGLGESCRDGILQSGYMIKTNKNVLPDLNLLQQLNIILRIFSQHDNFLLKFVEILNFSSHFY